MADLSRDIQIQFANKKVQKNQVDAFAGVFDYINLTDPNGKTRKYKAVFYFDRNKKMKPTIVVNLDGLIKIISFIGTKDKNGFYTKFNSIIPKRLSDDISNYLMK